VYLDPPYYVKGQRRLYANFYSEEDHQDIAEALSEVPFRWITSYDNEQEIRQLYRRHRKVTYYLHYSAADRDSGTEVMFFSDGLKVPRLARTCGVEAGGR
jgi:DNA adenine methylase